MSENPQSVAECLENDCLTLELIVAALDRLEQQWLETRKLVHARTRGYFTPDEDDAVRQILLSYRNYRIALYDIIRRSLEYARLENPALQIQVFMIGFAAGLTLYAKSLKLIHTYEREPLIRAKLNEPEEKFGLEGGFFEEVLAAYSSPRNYWLLIKATIFWRAHRRAVKRLEGVQLERARWLAGIIRRQRKVIPRRLFQVLRQRARYDVRLFITTVLNPFRRSTYALKRTVGTAFAGVRLCLRYEPAITPEIARALRDRLRPGDILLLRADEKLTSTILPGFWAHAAIYLGTRAEQAEFGLDAKTLTTQSVYERCEDDQAAYVIEAVSPKLIINSLEKCLFGDHVLALRPNVKPDEIAAALREASAHLGKPYDFEFDFNITHRIVCTELVYRAFHKKGPIAFTLVKRLGRFTLTGNDIVHHALDTQYNDEPQLIPSALVLKRAGRAIFIPDEQIDQVLKQIRSGTRPEAVDLRTPAFAPS